MELVLDRVEVTGDALAASAALPGSATVTVGPLALTVDDGARGARGSGAGPARLAWAVANRGDVPVAVRSVSMVFVVDGAVEPLQMFRNGYQSWSPTGVATFGVDVDPSTLADFEFLQSVHHADQRRAQDGELRSEWVTVLRDTPGSAVLVGFDGGSRHDGTLRLRRAPGGAIELWAEAFLGDAVMAPGEDRDLHGVTVDAGPVDVSGMLESWAADTGRLHRARVHAPFQVGWCSWYHYFHDVTEDALRSNLARSADWPFEVFQLDDGFQSAIGDWLTTNDRFPSSMDAIAGAIAASGRTPGLWIAPFLVAPDSVVATSHPDWLARTRDGTKTLRSWWNPAWGGGDGGFMYGLDTTNPEVLDHLEGIARALVEAGFGYLKLDFTFSPSLDGTWSDPSWTPAQRVRAGYEAVRRGAGDDAFILGCGVPLANVVGIVDGNRIGQDVAPLWALDPSTEVIPGYLGVQPATAHAYANTVTRSFMHRRLWLNDPDCIMLRASDTDLAPEAARTWAHAVGVSGGMVLVSDDLALLDADARTLLDEVVSIGRVSDARASEGAGARSPDLLDHAVPQRLVVDGFDLTVDPDDGTSELRVQ